MRRKLRSPSRRAFLQAGAAAGGLALFGGTGCSRLEPEGRGPFSLPFWLEDLRLRLALRRLRGLPLDQAIVRFFSYLELEPEGVARFVEAWRKETGDTDVRKAALESYLLSTDFFLHGADETRPLRFVRLYDPFTAPCTDPIRMGDATPR